MPKTNRTVAVVAAVLALAACTPASPDLDAARDRCHKIVVTGTEKLRDAIDESTTPAQIERAVDDLLDAADCEAIQ